MGTLSESQQRAWRALVTAAHVLDEALDRQAQRDGGMPHAYYRVLVHLYESPGHRQRLGDLAILLRYSPSRLTHALARMEKSSWVERTRSTDDRRVQFVALTDAGVRVVRKVAPLQATEVRARALSRLSPEQVAQLEQISADLVAGLDGA